MGRGKSGFQLVAGPKRDVVLKNACVAAGGPQPAARTFSLSDSGNAEFLASRFGLNIRYDHRRARWFVWRRHRWELDHDGEISRVAKAAIRKRLKEAAGLEDEGRREREVKHALASESRTRREAMLVLARAEHPIADAGDNWDADQWLLGVPNGVVDLRTGTLRDGQRDDRVTMNAAVRFDPSAQCQRFLRFLAEVFNEDDALITFVRRAIGYSLTGVTTEQCLFMCYGSGANGKSTLLQTIMDVLGDYALNTPFSTFELRERANIPNDVAALVNRRFVIASETNDGTRLNEARVKALTGCDPITARFLHAEFFTFQPAAKFWLSVNHLPTIRDDSHGLWRRIRLVPFRQRFAINQTLPGELRGEASGILAWAIRSCLEWQREGLAPPPAVLVATDDYARDSDPLAPFVQEACECSADAETRASELYAHYQQWAQRNGLSNQERLTATMFGRKLADRFERQATRSGKVYKGITRRPL